MACLAEQGDDLPVPAKRSGEGDTLIGRKMLRPHPKGGKSHSTE